MLNRDRVGWLFALVVAVVVDGVAGCTAKPLPQCPVCDPGMHCDSNSSTCIPDVVNGGDGSAPVDMPIVVGCSPACGGLTPKCNATNHCVGCAVDGDCPLGQSCNITSTTQASCAVGCSDDTRCAMGKKCCNKACVDVTADPANCGACGTSCMAPNASASCAAGQCTLGTCASGFADCNMNAKDGCETNVRIDPANCTACGMTCAAANAINGCADGCYMKACQFGYADCDMNAMNGCETSVSSDPMNCGGCGTLCKALPNASANCVAGNCIIGTCNQGFTDCDGNPVNGCEVNTGTDGKNCGACGAVCGNGLVCKNGSCTCQNCNFPNAGSSCINNMCLMGACNQGFADCNKSPNDGCEVNLQTDANNCSACGSVCPLGTPACSAGVCVKGSLHWTLIEPSACNSWCAGGPFGGCTNMWTCDMAHLGGYVWLYNNSMVAPPLTINVQAYGWVAWYCGSKGCGGPGPNAGMCNGGGNATVWQCVFN